MKGMTHPGCALDSRDRAVAHARVRSYRLILCNLNNDVRGTQAAVNEIENCPACLQGTVEFLGSMAASLCESIAQNAGADRAAAGRRLEQMLADAINNLPR